MYENKCPRVPIDDKHSRSSHALIDRNLLKTMQSDITNASELISSLREEKEKLRKALQQLQQENHEKNSIIRSLKSRIKNLESMDEDDEMVKELNQANLKLKNEIELSMHGISHRPSDITTEIINLTETFLLKIHDKPKAYQIFKTHMKSSNHFKQVIGNENWEQSTLLLLRFLKDSFPEDNTKHKATLSGNSSEEESEQENYNKIIQDSKHLLDTLTYQKSKLENLNHEFAGRGNKNSTTNSPLYRGNLSGHLSGNLSSDKIASPDSYKNSSHITSFYTANKLVKNVSKYKNMPKK